MNKTATIVIAATGALTLADAIGSILTQTFPNTTVLVVIDGLEFTDRVKLITDRYPSVKILQLPENTGGNGFYGHRIYAATSFLINTDYVLFLDEDNYLRPNHVASQILNCENNNLDWSYSLRRIYDKAGNYLIDDDCESLGKWPIYLSDQHFLVDTSSYCIKREVITRVGSVWYGGWGQDRQFFAAISKYFPKFDTTGLHTLCYRLSGNPNSVTKEFFIEGNSVMINKYGTKLPWNK
jgi:glycosyltransferase involved in cell wall biosynthesis